MKRVKYIVAFAVILILAACTNSDVLDNASNSPSLLTKSDDLEAFEVHLETAGTLSDMTSARKLKSFTPLQSGPSGSIPF